MPELGIGLGISKGAAPKTKLLVDKYNIDAAFSLRKVRAEYNGPCVRVRNSSGDLADIGFTNQGVLDEDALNAHCGDNDGTVQTWYNQSTEGGRFNAVQNTLAAQPVIYDASEGGYLGYLNTNQGGQPQAFDLENIVPNCPSIFAVYQMQGDSGTNNYLVSGGAQGITHRDVYNETGITWFENDTQPYLTLWNDGVDYDKKYLIAGYAGGATNFLTLNGYVAASDTDGDVDGIGVNALCGRTGGSRFRGRIWEIFLSTSDLSANRIAIENSILAANGLTVPEKTLLEKYGSGAVAYSLRSVNREYVGPIISLDCATSTPTLQNPIYLTSEGKINTQRITDLCTNPDTTTSNGYVRVWYDQSGQGIDASSTVSNAVKPAIFIGNSGPVLSNGEPAMLFNDFDTVLSTGFIPNNSGTSFAVFSPKEYVNTHTTYMFAKSNDSSWYLTAQTDNTNSNVMSSGWADGVTSIRVSGYGSITEEPGGRGFLWDSTNGKQSLVFVDSWGSGSKSWGISNYSNTGDSFNIEGYVQEWIWWEDSIKDSIDDIEKSVNKHYLTFQEATSSPSSGFLSDYDGAAAAYSVRQLGDANLCMKVRRSGDSSTKNIGFGTDGFVDTTAISDFCGTDDGFVVTWYDQSGNAVDASQSTAASQPKIYDGTDGVVKENGYPATEWSGGAQALETTYTTNSSEFTVVAVAKSDANATNKTVVLVPEALIFYQAIEDARHIQGNGAQTSYTPADSTDQMLHFVGNSGSESFAGDNGDTFTTLAESTATNGEFKIGNNANGSIGFDGKMQEVVYYTSDQSSNRTPIEENINDAFNVYPDADTTPESGFLSEFSGAAAAYSVRKLGDSPVCMRVRKTVSAVDYYMNVGFDSNGDLDTAAIEAFGGSADVFVHTWYDQSGNGRHQVQDTNAEQPKIYDATDGIIYENGKPAVQFSTGFMSDSSANKIDILGHSTHFVANRGTTFDREVLYGAAIDTTPYNTFVGVFWDNLATYDFRIFTNSSADQNFDLNRQTVDQGIISVLMPDLASDLISCQLNNNDIVENTGNPINISSASDFVLRLGAQGYNEYTGNIQEFILYSDGKSGSDRTNIEKNQNEHFLVHQSASTTPATGLLASHPAQAAYSVRQLGDALLCMKVASGASGNPTKNIGFKNGVLDTAAIESFCGNNDGFVATWYDQSGNDVHGSQSTHATRPKIYDNATGVVKENGKPALNFAVNDVFDLSSTLSISNENFFYVTGETVDVTLYGDGTSYTRNQLTRYISYDGSTFYTVDITQTSGYSLNSVVDGSGIYQNGTKLDDFSSSLIIDADSILKAHTAGAYQEFILYTDDQSASRSSIETNINNHYKIYTPFTTGLLDSYPGAAAAYSLRRLSSTYTGAAIEVTSNGSTQDIGFDIEGNLDTSALINFCGANDGTVSKWYDQSGNGNDAVQATLARQPKIYDGTTGVNMVNGEPSILSGSNKIFSAINYTFGSDAHVFASAQIDNNQSILLQLNTDYLLAAEDGSTNTSVSLGSLSAVHRKNGKSYSPANRGEVYNDLNGNQALLSASFDSSGITSFGIGYPIVPAFSTYSLGEIILYDSDQSDNQVGIEKNINKHYSIYNQPLLDVVPDAAAAYSLRKLRAGYTGPAINVYNGTDYKDIYFKSDGTLDTGAISRFCGSSDGLVAIWYDQSGNNNHASTNTAASRPKIYDGTTGVVTDNNGNVTTSHTSDSLELNTEIFLRSDDPDRFLISFVAEITDGPDDGGAEYFSGQTATSFNFFRHDSVNSRWNLRRTNEANTANVNAYFAEPASITEGKIASFALYAESDTVHLDLNGSELTASGGTAWTSSSGGKINFGEFSGQYDGSSQFSDGMYSEIIVWENHSDGDVEKVQANVNHYYSIY